MKRIVLFLSLAFAAAALADTQHGIPPRTSASDYAAHKQADKLTLGATALSAAQVRHTFSSDLQRGYVVLEIGVFPAAATDLSRGDFTLRVHDKTGTIAVHPSDPELVARKLQKKNQSAGNRDINVYPEVGVGYSTATRDPYGNRYPGGWSTSAGVGVGVGNPNPPASTDNDRRVMQLELQDKVLPEGKLERPVAGYLYFPVQTTGKATYELEYTTGANSKIVVSLPDAAAKK